VSKTSSRDEVQELHFIRKRIKQLFDKREHQHVVTWCTSLISRYPRLAILYEHRAHAQRLLDREDAALRDIDAAVQLAPKEPAHVFCRGKWRLEAGKYDPAVTDLTIALRLEAELGASYYLNYGLSLRALAHIMLGRFDEARADIERISPDNRMFARGRVWTVSDLARCVARKRRPSY
jgi:tetratricopeptide (TPR) repeat protein